MPPHDTEAALLLVGTVALIGVLHTAVPDHWVPIVVLGRQRGWRTRDTARAAARAGLGHVATTLLLALVVSAAGLAAAARFAHRVDQASGALLVVFGLAIALRARRHAHPHPHAPAHAHPHPHPHHNDEEGEPDPHPHHDDEEDDEPHPHLHDDPELLVRHVHRHRHGRTVHVHAHAHEPDTAHDAAAATTPPEHVHRHDTAGRGVLLLILGSSPMAEAIPAFFAGGRLGIPVLALMAAVLAAATVSTYVLLCTVSAAGLARLELGPLERHGAVLSGLLVAAVGVVFALRPLP